MIILDKDSYIAKGSHRNIYSHPNFPTKCLKIVMKEGQIKLRKINKHWYKRIRPVSWFNENRKEIKAYKILNKKDAIVFNYIPKLYDIIDTNLGPAMLIDYISNAITLHKYITKYGFTDLLQNELKNIFKVFYDNNVQIRDQHLDNYVIQIIDNNKINIKLIDGIGNSQIIPLAEHCDFIGRMQTKKRFQKLLKNLDKFFPQYKNEIENIRQFVLNIKK